MSNKAPLLNIDYADWLQAFRGITRSTDARTVASAAFGPSGVGNSAPVVEYEHARAVASALVLANMNSFPLDWAARLSVGGANMNFFIVKQLPVLPPEAHLEEAFAGLCWVEFIVPRALELTYTSWELQGFAKDLGYEGAPFRWDNERRFMLRCELDAAFFHMYGLEREEVDYIMDTFPGVEREDVAAHGEYRTKRTILEMYDELALCRARGYEYRTRLSPPPARACRRRIRGEPMDIFKLRDDVVSEYRDYVSSLREHTRPAH